MHLCWHNTWLCQIALYSMYLISPQDVRDVESVKDAEDVGGVDVVARAHSKSNE